MQMPKPSEASKAAFADLVSDDVRDREAMFSSQVPHGPGAVRVLIYRLRDSCERVLTGLPPPSFRRICDLHVTPARQTEQTKTSI